MIKILRFLGLGKRQIQAFSAIEELYMTEQKNSYSKMAVAGFCFAVLSLILVLSMIIFTPRPPFSGDNIELGIILFFAGVTCAILLPCFGSVFSIIGLIISIRKKKKGKALAIAGIVINELELIVIILFFVSIFLLWLGLGLIGY